jgi:aldoxime dehydratase
MAYFGVQTSLPSSKGAEQALGWIVSRFAQSDGPTHWDQARYIDEAGFTNVVTVAYWDDRAKFDGWFPAAREGWTGEARTADGVGTFIEVLYPSVEG